MAKKSLISLCWSVDVSFLLAVFRVFESLLLLSCYMIRLIIHLFSFILLGLGSWIWVLGFFISSRKTLRHYIFNYSSLTCSILSPSGNAIRCVLVLSLFFRSTSFLIFDLFAATGVISSSLSSKFLFLKLYLKFYLLHSFFQFGLYSFKII